MAPENGKPPASTAFRGQVTREMLCPLMCKLMSEHEHGDGAVRSGAAAAVDLG
jgi:hypothetical protein